MTEKKRVLFVCMGNICRSPAAEAVFKATAKDRGVGHLIEAESAGTIGYHVGERPDERMRDAGAIRGYRIDGRARQFEKEDFERFDLIVPMDQENLADIRRFDRNGRYDFKTRLLCDFIPDCPIADVPDPYYGGQKGFEAVLDLLEDACDHIIDDLLDGSAEKDTPE